MTTFGNALRGSPTVASCVFVCVCVKVCFGDVAAGNFVLEAAYKLVCVRVCVCVRVFCLCVLEAAYTMISCRSRNHAGSRDAMVIGLHSNKGTLCQSGVCVENVCVCARV